jgi:hypothetical protein
MSSYETCVQGAAAPCSFVSEQIIFSELAGGGDDRRKGEEQGRMGEDVGASRRHHDSLLSLIPRERRQDAQENNNVCRC